MSGGIEGEKRRDEGGKGDVRLLGSESPFTNWSCTNHTWGISSPRLKTMVRRKLVHYNTPVV